MVVPLQFISYELCIDLCVMISLDLCTYSRVPHTSRKWDGQGTQSKERVVDVEMLRVIADMS